MDESTEDKVSLSRRRAELVESLAAPLSTEDRVRIQGELSIVNAKIKAINTTSAAQLKAEADRRKVAGLTDFQANTQRAIAKVNGTPMEQAAEDEGEDDPGQTAAIDGWIDALLLRNDVDFTRSRDGHVVLHHVPKPANVMKTLIDAVYAAARGQELPDLPSAPPKAPKAKPKKR